MFVTGVKALSLLTGPESKKIAPVHQIHLTNLLRSLGLRRVTDERVSHAAMRAEP